MENKKITFSPFTSSDIYQPTEEQQQQLVATFPEHPQSTISTVLELTQGDMQRAGDMILSPPPLAALLQKLRYKISYERVQLIGHYAHRLRSVNIAKVVKTDVNICLCSPPVLTAG